MPFLHSNPLPILWLDNHLHFKHGLGPKLVMQWCFLVANPIRSWGNVQIIPSKESEDFAAFKREPTWCMDQQDLPVLS